MRKLFIGLIQIKWLFVVAFTYKNQTKPVLYWKIRNSAKKSNNNTLWAQTQLVCWKYRLIYKALSSLLTAVRSANFSMQDNRS